MTAKNIMIVVALLALIGGAIWYFTREEKVTTQTKEYRPGKQDTVYLPGTPDTIYQTRVYERVIRVPAEDVTGYGNDSSRVDSTIHFESGQLTLGVTTYPAIDSLRFDIELLKVDREIFRVDTLLLTRVDTIVIKTREEIKPAFYESWWFGSAVTALVGLTAILAGN